MDQQQHTTTAPPPDTSTTDALFGIVRHRRRAPPPPRNTAHASTPTSSATAEHVKTSRPKKQPRLRSTWSRFLAALMKDPQHHGAAYLVAFPKSSPARAPESARRLLMRPVVAGELARRQKISAARSVINRQAVEQRLYDAFTFDFRRFYHPAGHPDAGQPKLPHELDDEAARVIEGYKHVETKEGRRREFKIGSRKDMAELLAKMRGWVKDDGRPAITANFNFNFGPKPDAGGRVIEAIPLHLSGLKDASTPRVAPLDGQDDHEEGSRLPPGYRGVRPGGRAAELIEIFAPREDK